MRVPLTLLLSVVAVLPLSGCSSFAFVKIAPAVYEERRSDASYWTLSLDKEGDYFPSRLAADQTKRKKKVDEPYSLYFDVERGRWTLKDKKLILKSDGGQLRTFAVHFGISGHYLKDEAHVYPRSEERRVGKECRS